MVRVLSYFVVSGGLTWPLFVISQLLRDPHSVDLVITDMTMPEMTGDRLTREVKSIRPDMPVILCTGFNDCLSDDMKDEIGLSGYLMKQVEIGTLSESVRMALCHKMPRLIP